MRTVALAACAAFLLLASALVYVTNASAEWSGANPSPRRADRDTDVWVWTEAVRLHNQMQLTAPPAAPSRPWGVWDQLADCESGGDWSINTGNGYFGGLQFSLTSWRAVGGTGYPHEHSRDEQIRRGEALRALQGWGAWPACSRKLGLR